jgi:ABC-type polysaccharide/polyol phosphate export permease
MAYNNLILRTGQRGYAFELQKVWMDLAESTGRIYVAFALARHDIAARYRGSILGPFWITISMTAVIFGIAVLYSQLLKVELRGFLPFVALGITAWRFISTTIIEGSDCFVSGGAILRQSGIPMFTFVWRTVLRNLMVLAHHLIMLVFILAWSGGSLLGAFSAFLALLMVAAILAPVVCLTAIAAARFRDIPQIVGSVMQFAMFVTPVFWNPGQITTAHYFLTYNPFYYMLDALRAPLLAEPTNPSTWPTLFLLLIGAWTGSVLIFARTRRRIVHYL